MAPPEAPHGAVAGGEQPPRSSPVLEPSDSPRVPKPHAQQQGHHQHQHSDESASAPSAAAIRPQVMFMSGQAEQAASVFISPWAMPHQPAAQLPPFSMHPVEPAPIPAHATDQAVHEQVPPIITRGARAPSAFIMGRHSKLAPTMTGSPGAPGPPVSDAELKAGLKITFNHASGTRLIRGSTIAELGLGCPLFYMPANTTSHSMHTHFQNLPPVLANGLVVYATSEAEDHLMPSVDVMARGSIGPMSYARLYVLWPSCMERVPRWLRHKYTLLDSSDSGVRVGWHASMIKRMLLVMNGKYHDFKHQQLLVYESKAILPPNAAFATLGAGSVGEPTDQPYILAIKLASTDKALMTAVHSTQASNIDPFDPCMDTPINGRQSAPQPLNTGQLLTPELLANINNAAVSIGKEVKGRMKVHGSMALKHLGNLLHASNSTLLSEPLLGQNGKLDFTDMARIALAQRSLDNVKLLILLNVLAPNLKERYMYEQFERLAISRRDAELLLILQYKTSHELSVRGLAFLLNYMWFMGRRLPPSGLFVKAPGIATAIDVLRSPGLTTAVSMGSQSAGWTGVNLSDEIQAFLLHYTSTHRNPLSVTSAVLKGIQREVSENEECKHFMAMVASRFQTLNIALLKQLGRLIGHTHSVALLHSVLDPKAPSLATRPTVNDTSPLQVALDKGDLEFLVHPLVTEFTRRTWQGAAYKAQTACADPRSTSVLSPLLGWRLLKDAGFAGGAANFIVEPGTRLWHTYAFTSQAFFNSPRGRWSLHAMSELLFVIIFQMTLFYPDTWFTKRLLIVFTVMVVGNLLEIAQHVRIKYGSVLRINRYVQDLWNTLNLTTNIALFVLLIMLILQAWRVPGSSFEDGYQQGSGIHLSFCTTAVLVWVRSLSMVVPVYPRLGPLLITVARMLGELVAFIFPLFVVMAGFTSMLVGAFHARIATYRTFIAGLLTMFQSMLGSYSYDVFQTDDDGDDFPVEQFLFGSIMLSIYIILTTILLLNLLIAIITNRYRPDDLEAEMQMKQTRIVDYYHLQVQHNLCCSPFNIVQAFLFWLPARPRMKNRSVRAHVWALVPLDGPSAPGDVSTHLKAGWAEVPHFFFLLTLYPLMAAAANLSFYLFTPFAVVRFSSKTFKKLLKSKKNQSIVPDEPPKQAGGAAVAEGTQHADSSGKEDTLTQRSHTLKLVQELLHDPAIAIAEPSNSEWIVSGVSQGSIRDSRYSAREPGRAGSLHGQHVRTSHSLASSIRPAPQAWRPGPVSEAEEQQETPFQQMSQESQEAIERTSPSLREADALLYRNVSSALYEQPAPRQDSQLDKLEASLMSNPPKAGLGLGNSLLYWSTSWLLVLAGMLVYLLVLGGLLLTGWTTIYLWIGKLIFSLNNIFIAPWIDVASTWLSRRRSKHVQKLGGQEQTPFQQERTQAIRKKWQAAAARVVQARSKVLADEVMRPADLAAAIGSSKFARLLPKWGCSHLMEKEEDVEPAEAIPEHPEDGQGEIDIPSDDDDDNPNQDVLDAITVLKDSHTRLLTEVTHLRKRLTPQTAAHAHSAQ